MKEPPLATGFVAWHPEKGAAAETLRIDKEESRNALGYYRRPMGSEGSLVKAINHLTDSGWQIIEVEIFRKQKDGV